MNEKKGKNIEYVRCPSCGYMTSTKNGKCSLCDANLKKAARAAKKKEAKKKKLAAKKKEAKKKKLEKELSKRIRKILNKILNVSKRVSFEAMIDALEIDKEFFHKKIFDWASEFDFTIDGDYVIVNKETISDFAEALDDAYLDWERRERDVIGKK